MKRIGLAVLSAALLGAPAAMAQDCAFAPWTSYKGVGLSRLADGSAYLFRTARMTIDADGAPDAYHPDGIGRDATANAGWTGPGSTGWRGVLVPDPVNPAEPYRQARGPYEGYFLSMTTLEDPRREPTDPRRYVDASKAPYLVYPGDFYALSGTGLFGDLGVAIHANGRMSPFIVADRGGQTDALGEVSIALAEGLGGREVDPRTGAGAPQGEVTYVVFPYSARQRPQPWPMNLDEMKELALKTLELMGGREAVEACR